MLYRVRLIQVRRPLTAAFPLLTPRLLPDQTITEIWMAATSPSIAAINAYRRLLGADRARRLQALDAPRVLVLNRGMEVIYFHIQPIAMDLPPRQFYQVTGSALYGPVQRRLPWQLRRFSIS